MERYSQSSSASPTLDEMPGTLVLDANLSILVAVGLTKRDYIPKHKRLQGYDEIDFETVTRIIENSTKLVLTPNVLTETSNLINYIGEPIRSEVMSVFGRIINSTVEKVIESRLAVQRPEYLRLGLTDAVLLALTQSLKGTLLTVDLGLYLAALDAGLEAINYNHIKAQRPDYQ